jgi:acetolactate synthase-1/2/3 large subunit
MYVLASPNACGLLPGETTLVRLEDFVAGWLEAPITKQHWTVDAPLIGDVRSRCAQRLGERPSEGIWPGSIIRALSEVFPEEGIVTTDVGSHKFLFGQFWRSRRPQTFFMSNGLSSMGYGLPAALGAKLARPSVPVMTVVGDGGFAMNSQELETLARLDAPVIVVVMADNSLSLIKLSQESKNLRSYGVDFGRIDPVKTAEACGVAGLRVEEVDRLQRAVQEAVKQDVPLVVEVPIDYQAYRQIF